MYMNISGLEKETYLMPGILMVRIKIYLCFSVWPEQQNRRGESSHPLKRRYNVWQRGLYPTQAYTTLDFFVSNISLIWLLNIVDNVLIWWCYDVVLLQAANLWEGLFPEHGEQKCGIWLSLHMWRGEWILLDSNNIPVYIVHRPSGWPFSVRKGILNTCIIITPAKKFGGYMGITLSIRLFVCALVSGPYLSYAETLEVHTSHIDCLCHEFYQGSVVQVQGRFNKMHNYCLGYIW